MKENNSENNRNIRRYLNIPVQMLVIIGFGVFGGIQLDKLFNLKYPVFAVILALVSVIVAVYVTIKDLIK